MKNKSVEDSIIEQAEWELGIELFERSVEKKKEQIRKERNSHWWNWRIRITLVK